LTAAGAGLLAQRDSSVHPSRVPNLLLRRNHTHEICRASPMPQKSESVISMHQSLVRSFWAAVSVAWERSMSAEQASLADLRKISLHGAGDWSRSIVANQAACTRATRFGGDDKIGPWGQNRCTLWETTTGNARQHIGKP
jgi:hypothetical protein